MLEPEYNQHHKNCFHMMVESGRSQVGHLEEHHMIENHTLVALVLSEFLTLAEHNQKVGAG
jgi:hypothetical protein